MPARPATRLPTSLLPALLLAAAATAPRPASAQAHAGLAPSGGSQAQGDWSGRGELGLALSKGNTDSESFIGKFDVGYSDTLRKYAFGASAQYATTDGEESAHRYDLYGTSGFRLDPRRYLYTSLRTGRDDFGTYEYQWTAAAGYGYEAIRSDRQRLSFELGPGYRFAKDQATRVHHNQAIGRGFADWNLKLTDTATLVDTLLVESGSENTFSRNLLGVQVAVSKGLAMKAGLETRYNSRVDPGISNTDNLTTVNLVYDFK
jgi:putative salt-induced outer membrane protein